MAPTVAKATTQLVRAAKELQSAAILEARRRRKTGGKKTAVKKTAAKKKTAGKKKSSK